MPTVTRRGLYGTAAAAGAAMLAVRSRADRAAYAQGKTQSTATRLPPSAPEAPDQRLVFTYYYYWYDIENGGHLREEHGLRHHLPTTPAPNWRSVEWHKRQLADMVAAGIDVILPVYWGHEKLEDEWSPNGLHVLAQAWQELKAAGVQPPRIGMFFDTAIVNWRNLTSSQGKSWFYANFKDFFSRIPRDQWALINGKPVAFLFTSDWTSAMDQSTFDYVYQRFRSDFRVRPYIVREASWDYPILRWQNGERVWDYARPIKTENNYLWAASILGFRDYGGVAAVGPGYDDRLIPDRNGGRVTDREEGAFYRRHFEAAISSGKPLLAIETWNEIHEGSSVCETVEFGRQYIDLTAELTSLFHLGRR
ncbi:MAG TPA: DUF5010 domain-containing protein [Chloroflexota bacterium]|nr:DUF5010 domain-containing protein [Chloroflexota bacterium]